MALKNKDGSLYTLQKPNPVMKQQSLWNNEKFILHNMKCKPEIKEDDNIIAPVENDTNEFIKVERKIIPRRFTELEILEMTSLQKDELLNRIIDNGVENITEHDKKIIPFLVK